MSNPQRHAVTELVNKALSCTLVARLERKPRNACLSFAVEDVLQQILEFDSGGPAKAMLYAVPMVWREQKDYDCDGLISLSP